jgi:hypothetical protein
MDVAKFLRHLNRPGYHLCALILSGFKSMTFGVASVDVALASRLFDPHVSFLTQKSAPESFQISDRTLQWHSAGTFVLGTNSYQLPLKLWVAAVALVS